MSTIFRRPSFGKSPLKRDSSRASMRGSHDSLNLGINMGPAVLEDNTLPPGAIRVKLGDADLLYEDGIWRTDTVEGGASARELVGLRKQNRQLQEENQLLKYKIELLLDMLAVSNLDNLALEADLESGRQNRPASPRKSIR